jgi:hypothetical protein
MAGTNFSLCFSEPAQSSVQCPRKNGYFSHEDPSVCDRFYNCVDGVANSVSCPSGLIYDDYQGTCGWPETSQRPGCEKENRKKGKLKFKNIGNSNPGIVLTLILR